MRQGRSTILAKCLIDAGANTNAQSQDGTTPLMLAILNGHEPEVQDLLERGADLAIADYSGERAVDYCLQGSPIWKILEHAFVERGGWD